MSDKKITELQLRSNVNDDVNFPVDDGIQSYRVTAPQVLDYVLTNIADPKAQYNYSLVASVAASALTIALKTAAGSNPSATSPCRFGFRNSTITSGDSTIVQATAATSLVISSGSTLGTVSGVESDIYVYALNNGGTIELAASLIKMSSEEDVQTTVAEGGAGAADSGTTLYSTSTRTAKPVRLIGRIRSTQATAGTWATAPSEISIAPISESPFEFSFSGTPATTMSSAAAPTYPTWTTFNNSPTLTFTPKKSGMFKVYGNIGIYNNVQGNSFYTRVVSTSGSPTLLVEQIAIGDGTTYGTYPAQTVYHLVAGVTYAFDLQGSTDAAGNSVYLRGDIVPQRIFVERMGD